ncbi:hypothetical protein DFP72DRAFT_894752 [Ephemerocybe angulata]|uniref:Uncharacterized protein n=1 Tax=Ephemerocybe angulata TaxID=980116 RepID=A0A8H6HZK3_9AGAR|nr:hypothetical protein DFP72DRAFT_894752 [Tulosesus angulatus]
MADIMRLTQRLRGLDASRLVTLVRTTPTILKYLAALVFILNIRSWPLGWHFRIFRPAIMRRLQHRILKLRTMFYSQDRQARLEDEWYDSISPIGSNPMDTVILYKAWASLDESDFNGHLSNSSYAKTLDAARFKSAIVMFPNLFREQGWIPLAATHYHFIREIPMLAVYEIRSRIVAWDQKWFYLVHRFVTKPKKGTKHASEKTKRTGTPPATILPSLRTVSGPEESSSAPSPTPADTYADKTKATLKSVSNIISAEEPDGATLHTITVSQLCFKIGRITVPPELIFAINGFTAHSPPSLDTPFSHSNLPPHMEEVRKLNTGRGGRKSMGAFLKGGWRQVPQGERWWEQAFEGLRERNARNLAEVEQLKKGLEGSRGLEVHGSS